MSEIARRLGHDWVTPTAEEVWNEFRVVAPHFAGGMSYARLESLGGMQWPCPDESHPGETFLHSRLWEVPRRGRAAPFSVVHHDPPVEQPDDEYPFVLTTGRRLESYNTGVQTAGYVSPLHSGETLDISPEDAARLRIADGDLVRIESRRGRVEAPARIDEALRAGMVFMTLHFPDDVADQFPDDRRLRSEVGHRRVQGLRRARRASQRAGEVRSYARPSAISAKGGH